MFHHAAAAYAAMARLALSGPELDAQVLIGSAGRLRRLREAWPPQRGDLDAALDHAARVWSVIVADRLADPGDALRNRDQDRTDATDVAALAEVAFRSLHGLAARPSPDALSTLLDLTLQAANTVRQFSPATPPDDTTKDPHSSRLQNV